jgi:hypothetical protein
VERRWSERARQHAAATSELATQQRAYQAAVAELQGQRAAVQLYQSLAAGDPPPALPTSAPDGATVHLDVALDCASWYGQQVQYRQFSTFAVGSPPLVATSLLGTAIFNRRSQQRAEATSQPQWHSHGFLRFLVSPTATWCGRGTDWRHFAHSASGRVARAAAGHTCVSDLDAAPVPLAFKTAWRGGIVRERQSHLIRTPRWCDSRTCMVRVFAAVATTRKVSESATRGPERLWP